MIFYFIAMRPHLEKAVNDKIYLNLEDAQAACEWLNGILPPYRWQVWAAEAVNISEVGCYGEAVPLQSS